MSKLICNSAYCFAFTVEGVFELGKEDVNLNTHHLPWVANRFQSSSRGQSDPTWPLLERPAMQRSGLPSAVLI